MVRSLDVQQIILQSNAVERVQQVQQHQADVQQQHLESQLAREKRVLREKVKDLEKAEQLMIKEEDRDNIKKKKNKTKKKKMSSDDTCCDLSLDEPVRKIDIRI